MQPRAAVLSEGAERLAAETLQRDQAEAMEETVEGVMFLCDCAPEFTDRICVGLELIAEFNLTIHELDGTARPGPSL